MKNQAMPDMAPATVQVINQLLLKMMDHDQTPMLIYDLMKLKRCDYI